MEEEKAPEKDRKTLIREYVEAIVIAFILAMFIRTFIVQAFKIPSGSMKPNLLVGDHILVNKFIYGIRNPFTGNVLVPVKEPERGDVMVFVYPVDPDKDFIKRVVGVPGDRVEVVNKKVYVNGQLLPDDITVHTEKEVLPKEVQPRDNLGPVVVPAHSLFVMGDNRDQSYDSRFWGFVPSENIKGKAFIIYWSWDSANFGVRWNRLGKIIRSADYPKGGLNGGREQGYLDRQSWSRS